MNSKSTGGIAVAALRQALPYLKLYQGRSFVVKVGGELFDDEASLKLMLEQVGVLHRMGIRVALVHGAGPQIGRLQRSVGDAPQMVDGRRVTDGAALRAVSMSLGELGTRTVAMLKSLGVSAVSVSGVDGSLFTARRRAPLKISGGDPVDYGFVGDIETVDPKLISVFCDEGFLPVISPLSCSEDGVVLNVNADTAAAQIAIALGAEKLLIATGAPGILEKAEDPSTLVSYVDVPGLDAMIEAGGIQGGMLPKVAAIKTAIAGGIPRVHIISHRGADSLLTEVFTNEGSGTLVVAQRKELLAHEGEA